MNKKTIWWVVGIVVVIIIVAAIWWGAGTAKAPEVASNAPTSTAMASGTPANASGTTSSSVTVSGSSGSSTVTVTMADTYRGSSYSFNYPFAWTIESEKPFVLTTFGGRYINNDVIPPGGAEIDIATTTVYGNLQAIMQTELMSATNVTTSAITVDGTSCAEAKYDNTYTGGTASKDIAVYCPRGNELWKFYLSYRADDAQGSTHVTDFTNVLASMKLL